jgi:HEAT repeat protein
VLPLLGRPRFAHAELAVELLTWSKDSRVAPFLRDWVARRLPLLRRAQARQRPTASRRRSVPADLPYQAILKALRGHPSEETELFLLLAARDWDPTYRAAAVSSLGWWEPVHRTEVLPCLQQARRDANAEVRHAARAALARLGERQALQGYRQALSGEDGQLVHETLQTVAAEGLTLLWPDLDKLADAGDSDVAHHARESLARLAEDMDRSRA